MEWLTAHDHPAVISLADNIGVGRGLNKLLDMFCHEGDYDVIAHFDNDCLLTQPDTLRGLAELVLDGDAILSPRILGLNNPPQPTREVQLNGEIILDIPQIGGIFLTAPGWVYDEYRYPENLPLWGMDDAHLCDWFRRQGGTCGYVKRLEAWHYEGTQGQHERYPQYFERRVLEGGPV